MRSLKSLLLITVLALLWSGAAHATTNCKDTNGGTDYGQTLVTFDGVPFRSNGDRTGSCHGEWQCVEGVKRFYKDAAGFAGVAHHEITQGWGLAKNAFSLSDQYLTAYANGTTGTRPQPGDIICFGTGTSPGYPNYTNSGHVGIISKVVADANGNGHVYMVDQNRTRKASEQNDPLKLTYSGGHYGVASFSSPRYVTQGWLRNLGYDPPGTDPAPTPPVIPVAPPTTYTNQVSAQDPYVISLLPGQTASFSVTYINTGSGTWKGGSTSASDANYVELKTCNSTGATETSWLYWSGTNGWLSSSRVTTCEETTVERLGSATFDFTVYVPLDKAPGTYQQYFRVHHNTGGALENLDGVYNVCYVEITVLDASRYEAFTGKFNTDTKWDVGIWDKVSGDFSIALRNSSSNQFDATGYWLTDWHAGALGDYKLLVGDFSGDGYSDLCLYQPSTGNWYVAYNQGGYFQQSSGPGSGGAWATGWAQGSGYVPLAGDFSGDGVADVAAYYPSLGRWFVAYNQSATSGGFQQHNGPGTNNSWITGWATEDGNGYRPYAADVSGDGYADIIAYSPLYGRWFVAYNQGGSFQNASGPQTNGSWITNWAKEDGSQWRCFVTDLSGDGYGDLLAYSPIAGIWFVAYNQGGYFNGQSGPEPYGSWITSWNAEHDGYQWQLLTPDVSGDGYADLLGYTPAWGRWFVAYNQGGSFAGESGTQTGGSWLDNWGKLGEGVPLGQGTSSARMRPVPRAPAPPLAFSLSVTPNPSTSRVTLRFTLPVTDRVQVSIYDIAGRQVAQFPASTYAAGTHSLTWDGLDHGGNRARNGIYFVRFTSHFHTTVTRVVVVY